MGYKLDQIKDIIIKNPRKAKLEHARKMAKELRLHVNGDGTKEAIDHCDYFASPEVYELQKKYAVSNKDLFERVLGQEDMVFTTRGGSSVFSLPDDKEKIMNAILEDVCHHMSLRKWVQTFALQAYRTDPMSIVLMEIEPVEIEADNINTPDCYPTYKASKDIYDYDNIGRLLKYVAFQLTVENCLSFGIQDEKLNDMSSETLTDYFRFIDDEKDVIVKRVLTDVILVTNISQLNPIKNIFGKVPGFIVSDLVTFDDTNCFNSPLNKTVELSNKFLQSRSIRDLQQLFHGFAKAVEPLINCEVCDGNKIEKGTGNKCPTCKGTGHKLKTKVSDVLRIPMDVFAEASSFNFRNIFGYNAPDIESWNKQDTSLYELALMIYETYWHTRPGKQTMSTGEIAGGDKTATQVLSDLQPIFSRLNKTADWAETTEKMIADFIGTYWFREQFKKSTIVYSRDYILRTPEEYMNAYQALLTKGAPDFAKDEALEKYYQAKYQTNTMQMQKYLKMLNVEPFPHDTVANIEKSTVIKFEDRVAKRYFGEWSDTIPEGKWILLSSTQLKEELMKYIRLKGITDPAEKETQIPTS